MGLCVKVGENTVLGGDLERAIQVWRRRLSNQNKKKKKFLATEYDTLAAISIAYNAASWIIFLNEDFV